MSKLAVDPDLANLVNLAEALSESEGVAYLKLGTNQHSEWQRALSMLGGRVCTPGVGVMECCEVVCVWQG